MALKDDPKVQELIAKATAKATKDTLKLATAAAKEAFALHLEGAAGDKVATAALKNAQKEVLNSVKNAAAGEE